MKYLLKLLLFPLAKWYWSIVRPKTYGVKVLITNPLNKSEVLLVRHSYGNTSLWNLPGGGYRPSKETPIEAAKREIHEELGVELLEAEVVGEYYTTAEGKRDTVSFITGALAESSGFTLNYELETYAWAERSALLIRGDVARVAKEGIRQTLH